MGPQAYVSDHGTAYYRKSALTNSDGALLVSTFIPFEGTDGEDSTALSVGEMITKVQAMRQAMNQERKAEAAQMGKEPDLVPQCEHLWVVSGVCPLIPLRLPDSEYWS